MDNFVTAYKITGSFILLAACILHTTPCRAAWEQAISARISTEYETNPAMLSTSTGDVWRTLLEPGYMIIGKFGEDELRTGLGLQISRSSNQSLSQDRDSPSAFIDWLRQLDTGEFGVSSKYAEVATRNADIDATGQVPVASKRSSRTLTGRWKKDFSERSTLSADGMHESVFYTGGIFVDYVTRSASMMFSYILSERNQPFLKALYADYEPAGGGPANRLESVAIGLNWNESDNLGGSVQIGKSRIDDTDAGTQGAATLQYTGQKTRLNLGAARHVSASGLGGFVTVDQIIGNWGYTLSELSSAGLDLLWQQSKSSTAENIRTSSGAWLQNELNTYWILRTYFQHNTLQLVGVDRAYSNILGFALVYTRNDF